jgi:predicted nuclease of predicted toxin-antitoxin system
MSSYLVDVNLLKYFSYFNESTFVFVADLDLQMSDTEIWNYAISNDLIILTKDVDFYSKFLISEKTPKIIYFQIGNYSLKQLHEYFKENWIQLSKEITTNRMIIAKETHIECII